MDFSTNQNVNNNGEKTKKILKISIVFCVILLLIVLALYAVAYSQDKKTLKLFIDGKNVYISEDLFKFDDGGFVYVNIEEFAKLVSYNYYKGEYGKYSEDSSKCYVSCNYEISGFEAGSNRLYKINNTGNYDWYDLEEPVKMSSDKLYCKTDGISLAFNINFSFDAEKNRIVVITLDNLFSKYQEFLVNNYNSYGYNSLALTFENEKALLYNMLVVMKAQTDSSGKPIKDSYKYGVISPNMDDIIGAKYDNLEFIEATKEFYATDNGKIGILSSEGAQKINIAYDDIELIDNDLRLYYVKNGNFSGVLDKNGKQIVYLEYSGIGVNTSLFTNDNIKNGRLLYDNCIPVCKNNKWGLISINGNVLLETEYDSLGYIGSTQKDLAENNLLLIPDIEGIIVYKDGKYGIVSSTGKAIAPCAFEKIYSVTNMGKSTYYLTYISGDHLETITWQEYQKLINSQINEADETNTRTAE